jgi:hypothetical protein
MKYEKHVHNVQKNMKKEKKSKELRKIAIEYPEAYSA